MVASIEWINRCGFSTYGCAHLRLFRNLSDSDEWITGRLLQEKRRIAAINKRKYREEPDISIPLSGTAIPAVLY
jgi:hypothetical protein